MPPNAPDSQLVRAYAAGGSESAFQALVARHIHLVYATALRQVGEVGIAEEVTQNVFVALARKAPRLGGLETLAGWLHRTAILEAKARIRSELRRSRREETAAQWAVVQSEGTSPLEALVPLLDEGMLRLREADRVALLLRFFEDRSLRDVGESIGVDEDAARKRVARALDRLTEFFRQHGFAVPAGTGVAALMAHASVAAPATLVPAATSAGLAAGSAATGLSLLLLHTMSLTKTQTVAVSALLVAIPIALQWQSQTQAKSAWAQTTAQVTALRQENAEVDTEIIRARNSLEKVRQERALAEQRRAALRARQSAIASASQYAWDDTTALARVPKEMLGRIGIRTMQDVNGGLTDQIKEALQMTDDEAERVETAMRRAIAEFRALEGAQLKPVPPREDELQKQQPEDVRVFEVPSLREQYSQWRDALLTEVGQVLGEDRLGAFKHGLDGWLILDDDYLGTISTQVLYYDAKRVRIYKPGTVRKELYWSVEIKFPNGGGSSMGLVSYNPPDPYRQHIADWLELDRQLRKTPAQASRAP